MANFPTSLDSLTNPWSGDYQDLVPHTTQHANANDILEALEVKVWITWSSDTSSLDYKTSRITAKGSLTTSNGSNLVERTVWTDGYMLVADSTKTTWLDWIAPTSGGTVTTLSVVSANGLAWSVANATTTPAITLTTSITGLLKGNGTAISAASAWTDYLTPSGSWASLTGIFPVGMITPYAWTSAPTGWLICDGSAVSRTVTYSALFAITSTLYWVGDWSTTFNLPDLRGRVPVGKNTWTFTTLGSTWWAETHTLTTPEIPAHTHDALTGYVWWGAATSVAKQASINAPFSESGYIATVGWGWAHNNLQPYQTINYIIKY